MTTSAYTVHMRGNLVLHQKTHQHSSMDRSVRIVVIRPMPIVHHLATGRDYKMPPKKSILNELYWERNMSQYEIAEKLDVTQSAVSIWMVDYGIETRGENIPANTERPWRSREKLMQRYIIEEDSIEKISEDWQCSSETIHRWLNTFEIETRGHSDFRKTNHAFFYTRKDGYEEWSVQDGCLLVHRLLAVSEFGFEEVCGKVVHHKNEIPWDNRDDNIELMELGEHSRYHLSGRNINRQENDYDREEWLWQKYWDEGMTLTEIAEEADENRLKILNRMKYYDIPRRKPGRRKKNAEV